MFELTIKKENGDTYWVERFNTLAAAQKWIAIEQTRSYWDPAYTYEIVDKTPPPPTQDELDAIDQRKQQLQVLKARLKALAAQSDLTAAEVKELVLKLAKFLYLKDQMFD